ncbi:hypothetical protein PSECIP111854_02849 [Pseudoalteromonas sp. CIP111854]|uniref:Uncharacterized protein n=1 Tax=Pseudoalteromonas holothuriae TaxID=2963714 RepID=A0A9W4W140_9GAMM|nr:hypothetical protein [Pseudoalteromonas sp. CIP111854]CAH9061627.1 hypothetical protein PSECIP111854_02849 [Pseudoalteromonas sp. CIP111854]
MLPPINKSKANFGYTSAKPKEKSDKTKKQAVSSYYLSDPAPPLKGQIRQLVFSTLKHKFGDKLENEPEFIKMVDTVCAQIEPSITNSRDLQNQLDKLLKGN